MLQALTFEQHARERLLVAALLVALPLALTTAGMTADSTLDNSPAPIIPANAWPVIRHSMISSQPAYHLTPSSESYRAASPEQRLETTFDPSGPAITTADGAWTLGLELRAYGYGRDLHPVQPAILEMDGPRLDYRRGSLTEWYLNGPFGLEQGFTLTQPPSASSGLLTLELAFSGDWQITQTSLDADGLGLTLSHPATGTALRYANLAAWDAVGHPLPAHMTLHGNRLHLRISDHGARYPLTIDPTIFVEQQKLTDEDAEDDDNFGFSVDISGDTIVVGALGDNSASGCTNDCGAALVFERSGGAWTQSAKLTAADPEDDDVFGHSVAISGDTIVVGARGADDASGCTSDCGAVYVFEKSNSISSVWEDGSADQSAKLTANDAEDGDLLGFSVAISGDTIVTGATLEDDASGCTDACGAAYVFEKSNSAASTWEDGSADQSAKLTAADAGDEEAFGVSVAISGDTVVVGSHDDNASGCTDNCGAVYVFEKSNSAASAWEDGSADQSAKLTANDAEDDDTFGGSVAISGDTIVVGAQTEDNAGICTIGFGCGAVYVFEKSNSAASAWENGSADQSAKLTPADLEDGDGFGNSVAISGDTIVVGAETEDDASGCTNDCGAAYVFGVSDPEMDVQGSGNSIPDGDTTPDTADDTDFGTTTPGLQVKHTFTIENSGSGDLTLTGMPEVTLSGSSTFSVTSQPSTPVASGGGTTTFTVLYHPLVAGSHTATVSIDNDDADEDPYTFDVTGSASPASLWQVGQLDLPVDPDLDPYLGSDEFPYTGNSSNPPPPGIVWNFTYDYTIGQDGDPINAPDFPGYMGPMNVCDVPLVRLNDSDNRPCVDTAQNIVVHFSLQCDYPEGTYQPGDLVFQYSRYGSEVNYVLLDGEFLGVVDPGAEYFWQEFSFDLGPLPAGEHTIEIRYAEALTGMNNGHYIDRVQLLEQNAQCGNTPFACPAGTEPMVIDFETDAAGNPLMVGDVIAEQWASWGVHVENVSGASQAVMAYNSSSPSLVSTASYLGTPHSAFGGPGVGSGGTASNQWAQGNMMYREATPGHTPPPMTGTDGVVQFNFDAPSYVHRLDVVNSSGTLEASNGWTDTIPDQGANAYQEVVVNQSSVDWLRASFSTEIGVARLVLCEEPPEPTPAHWCIDVLKMYKIAAPNWDLSVWNCGASALSSVVVSLASGGPLGAPCDAPFSLPSGERQACTATGYPDGIHVEFDG